MAISSPGMKSDAFERIVRAMYHGLIVSCHADKDEPFDTPEFVAGFARAAEMGGAVALRIAGVENIRAVKSHTKLPIVGFIEGKYEEMDAALITPDFSDVEKLLHAGADIIALDCTIRRRPNGMDGLEFFKEVRKRFDTLLWADVSVFREGVKAAEYGADFVATTLSGYTAGTTMKDHRRPDFALIRELSLSLTIPVIAEGRIWTPQDAAATLAEGAYGVVVGTAITRPRVVTQMFVSALSVVEEELPKY